MANESENSNWNTSYTAEECEALTERQAFIDRCFSGDFQNGEYVGDLQCMPHSPPQRIRGVWVIGLEYSTFFPNANSYDQLKGREEKIWLDDQLSDPSIIAAGQGAGSRTYFVDLIGRRSLCDWLYGHMGMWPQQIIAERFISMRRLPMPQE